MGNWRGWLLLPLLLWAGVSARAADGLLVDWAETLASVAALTAAGERVVAISQRFLGTPYRANTLGGGSGRPEELVVTLDAVDCFTLLDYVEALRRSANPGEFRSRLLEVRYRDGEIAWEKRRHFFTDWTVAPGERIVDVTAEVGGKATRQAAKRLNLKADGTLFLPGVAVQERIVRFIPAAAFDDAMRERLQTGDYLGIYSPEPGLDVAHVGIVVRCGGRLCLRHASSRSAAARVVDSDLADYLAGQPGAVILRPR